jgi:hypothetical protein
VYSDGFARFESDSGWIIWLTDQEQTYGWECGQRGGASAGCPAVGEIGLVAVTASFFITPSIVPDDG